MRRRKSNPSRKTILIVAGIGLAALAAGVLLLGGEKNALAAGGGGGAPAPSPGPGPSSGGERHAIVTTNDPAPAGDLFFRHSPGSPGIPGFGAEKGGTVTILNPDVLGDGVWAEVSWPGGSRLGPAQGFAKNQFLRPV